MEMVVAAFLIAVYVVSSRLSVAFVTLSLNSLRPIQFCCLHSMKADINSYTIYLLVTGDPYRRYLTTTRTAAAAGRTAGAAGRTTAAAG